MKNGYTTGTCAAAAAKVAAQWLTEKAIDDVDYVTLKVPSGDTLVIPIHHVATINPESAMASVIKDGGDDQDSTHGLEIQALVTLTDQSQKVSITGGKGVGTVTKPGLQIPIGHAAINPVPLKMIEEAVRPFLPSDRGFHIEIGVPNGEAVGAKTFNPRLGIVGGISIIGTSGIVRPMSEEAYKATIETELKQKWALGNKKIVLVPGMHGEKYAISTLGASAEIIVHMGNFIGFTLQACVAIGFEHLLIVGHIGKLIKLSGGIFNTHSKVADAKAEILITQLAFLKAPMPLLEGIYKANTTDQMVELLRDTPYFLAFQTLGHIAKEKCLMHIHSQIPLDCVFYDLSGRQLADTRKEINSCT